MFNSNNGYSLADVAAATGNNRNNDGMWGDGGWWIILLFLVFGYGGFGAWGNGFGGANGAMQGYATQADIMRGFDNQTVVGKLDRLGDGLCSLGYDQLSQMNNINQNVSNGFNGVERGSVMDKLEMLLENIRKTNPEMDMERLIKELTKNKSSAACLVMIWLNIERK